MSKLINEITNHVDISNFGRSKKRNVINVSKKSAKVKPGAASPDFKLERKFVPTEFKNSRGAAPELLKGADIDKRSTDIVNPQSPADADSELGKYHVKDLEGVTVTAKPKRISPTGTGEGTYSLNNTQFYIIAGIVLLAVIIYISKKKK